MPRDGTKNLKPTNTRTKEEQKEIARMGGIASGAARRKKKSMKDSFEALFAMQATDKLKNALKKQGVPVPDDLNHEQALVLSMTMRAIAGDARMASLILDVLGEKKADCMKEREIDLKEREIDLKEKQATDTKKDALEKLDEILKGLKDAAFADEETE